MSREPLRWCKECGVSRRFLETPGGCVLVCCVCSHQLERRSVTFVLKPKEVRDDAGRAV